MINNYATAPTILNLGNSDLQDGNFPNSVFLDKCICELKQSTEVYRDAGSAPGPHAYDKIHWLIRPYSNIESSSQ